MSVEDALRIVRIVAGAACVAIVAKLAIRVGVHIWLFGFE